MTDTTEWQPIETAPKDGTRVDLWAAERERYGNTRITDCFFREGKWLHSPTIYDDEDWAEKNGGFSPVYNVMCWRPSPPPPEIISDRELARRVGNGERPHVVKVGDDRWQVKEQPE